MRQRVILPVFWAIATALLLATPASAQVPAAAAPADSRGEVALLLQRGDQLEKQRSWGEALSLYENAVRQCPHDTALRQRFDNARLHYDLVRRYADRSFRDMLARMPFDESLALYARVLEAIETHHVTAPRWDAITDGGARGLWMALDEPAFVERNVPWQNWQAIAAFRRDLSGADARPNVPTRDAARQQVARIAEWARQRLGIAPAAVVLEYICGAANSLDPYSAFLTPGQLNETYSRIDGNYVGLGVKLETVGSRLVVASVVSRSPADEAGIRTGDQISAVDGRSTDTLPPEQAADLLLGPDGSTTVVTLAAAGQGPRDVQVRRRVIDVPSIERVAIADQRYSIGYLKISCFQKTTPAELDAALWQLHRQGMKSLMIDVRGNPGGQLLSAVEVADRFVDRGLIVSIRGRIAGETGDYPAREHGKWRIPLVVMVDQDSASAAEIFAGAIRDHGRGTLVGVRSFGKGSVQNIMALDGWTAGIRLTTATIYLPNGQPYNGIGIDPDVVIPAANDHLAAKPIVGQPSSVAEVSDAAATDVMFAGAIQVARSQAAKVSLAPMIRR
jgi:carboxyl-terminal processing protease